MSLELAHHAITAVSVFTDSLPNPGSEQPPGTKGISDILGWVKWVALAVCIAGLIAAGAMMAVSHSRGGGGEHVGRIGMSLGGVIVISAAFSLVSFLAS
jgi:hypothetical protein